ncbi:hypothetical protein DPU24_27095 [Salmonella enterica subsp. enterica serovar Oranienburg]|uniref:Uncharacterized protein n=1 Tax=Salmonella enterica subsp. enterica serovar Eastbourne TaxID=486993 RepID=A0A702FGJ4_SALET|nr:hypothetical protein [Salmonella enterica subsp. enterica serovar Oranienburg]EBZ9517023.1 hypothetical protein [Salmonella enterica subsp. enterica serovar Eastbourne]ECA1898236.1 hypothetical protein [Salmonella enterica subsp. enterica serovar Eastbourne]HAC6678781.1 hypothetical protein [Salmonella enterica subsp. enterica serovar Eastbourne]HAE5116284.1 hypothetical protein [Salmonella enterica subsp. enterica serovar Eastbourne]
MNNELQKLESRINALTAALGYTLTALSAHSNVKDLVSENLLKDSEIQTIEENRQAFIALSKVINSFRLV